MCWLNRIYYLSAIYKVQNVTFIVYFHYIISMYGKSKNIDFMTIIHFLIWFVFGTLIPNKYTIALILSVAWELFERFVVIYKPLYNFVKSNWFVPETYWNENPINSMIDIFVNMIGYLVGSNIQNLKMVF